MRITRYIIGLVSILSLVAPLAASANSVNVLTFDTASGSGSLYESVVHGTIEPRVREIQTIIDPATGKPVFFEPAYQSNMHELGRYADSYACRSHIDLTKCLIPKKK